MSQATALVPLPLQGCGTTLVESLESYLVRLAATHSIRPRALARLLRARALVWSTDDSLPSPGGDERFWLALCDYVGVSGVVQGAVSTLERLTGQGNLRGGTLLPLAGVLPCRGLSALSTRRRWCPECYAEGRVAEPLAWSIALNMSCPLHHTPLRSRCAGCGANQPYFAAEDRRHYCCKCHRSLVLRTVEKELAPWQLWCDDAIAELLSGTSRLGEAPIDPKAFSRFVDACCETYYRDKRVPRWAKNQIFYFRKLTRRGKTPHPTLMTVCRLAAIHSVSLVDLLQRPEQAAQVSFVMDWRTTLPVRRLKPISEDRRTRVLSELRMHLGASHEKAIPSLRQVCLAHDVRPGDVSKWDRSLCKQYADRRREEASRVALQDAAAAVSAAKPILEEALALNGRVFRKDVVKAVSSQLGLGRTFTETALEQVWLEFPGVNPARRRAQA